MNPSVISDIAGPSADVSGRLFWFFFWTEAVVGALVLGFLFLALWRRRERNLVEPLVPTEETEKRLSFGVTAAVAATVFILTTFVGVSYFADKKLIDFARDPEFDVEVIAHQWWWEIRYPSPTPSEIFSTANEIHVPVGHKVRLRLQSSDVIHSLWFPNLAGKRDIFPGRDQDLVIEADKEGTFHGRCAEFCGMQHAMMELRLISESQTAFDDWKKAQAEPAVDPVSAEELHGRDVFTKGACVVCHVIRGTEAKGYSSLAPDLTHLKSRLTIGAGAAPNTKGYLGGWIIDPHGIKPGVHMPTMLQEPQDLQALLSYLETLK